MKYVVLILALLLPLSASASTLTVFPDPSPAVNTDDGNLLYDVANNLSWATVHDAASAGATQSPVSGSIFSFQSANTSGLWINIVRGIFTFDTSPLTSSATISAATFSLVGTEKSDGLSITPDINVFAATPAANASITGTDYAQTGTTAFATAITYSSWSTSAYNDFALNANGIANISLTGISKFSAKNANYDAANTPPAWNGARLVSDMSIDYASTAGTGSDPQLVITYTLAAAAASPRMMLNAQMYLKAGLYDL